MVGKWTRHWMVAFALAVAGVTIACTENQDSLAPAPNEESTGSGPQAVLIPMTRLSPECSPTGSSYAGDVYAACVEVWGEAYIDMDDQFAGVKKYECRAWGLGPNEAWMSRVWTPIGQPNSYTHAFGIEGHRSNGPRSWLPVHVSDATRFKGEATSGLRPTYPGQPATVKCVVDNAVAIGNVEIWGDEPLLMQVSISAPRTTITPSEQIQLTAAFKDTYGFTGDLLPVPTVSWSSSNTAIATVSSTGLVTAVNDGPVTIYADPLVSSNAPATVPTAGIALTVTRCSQITNSPASANLQYLGATSSITANLTCPPGVLLSAQKLTWSATPSTIVSVTAAPAPSHTATVNPNLDGGTTQVKACTPYNVCGTTTVNVARIKITSFYDGSAMNVQPGASSEVHFNVQNTGVGTTAPFTMYCSGTGTTSCNVGTVQPSPSTLAAGQFHQLFVPFTASVNPGPGTIRLTVNGQTHIVNVNVSNTTGNPVAVDMTQYQEAARGVTCTWTATPTGGTTPYASYEWTIDGTPMGTNSPTFTYTTPTKAMITSFNIGVTVTDALGAIGSTSNTITLLSSGTGCYY